LLGGFCCDCCVDVCEEFFVDLDVGSWVVVVGDFVVFFVELWIEEAY